MTKMITLDGNEAAASVAHRLSEIIAIYPITPSSTMAEHSDNWSALGKQNIWGQVPKVIEMQSEGGAAGTVHGALLSGAFTTTFTASQGLLLMIPNMYKIAGELTPTVFHVSARSLAAQGLSIFGDHSDVMAVRQTGFGMIASNSVQEAHDLALISHAASLKTRIPFVHFFDGFRTSHEVSKISYLSDEVLASMVDERDLLDHRSRALTPDRPSIRGTAQNPDVYFQGRETVNPYYNQAPEMIQALMERFAKLTQRHYDIVEYFGSEEAERVVVLMGSGAETVSETVQHLLQQDEKVGVLVIRLFRPFPTQYFLEKLPKTAKKIAVLDRTKEPGAAGEPLYQDVLTALSEAWSEGQIENLPKCVGGRYGLSSKEFTPAMVKGLFEELKKDKPKNHFTLGIVDDVTFTSLEYDKSFSLDLECFEGLFFGLGSDGTVGANKNSIKIIGESTSNFAQGYFVYDSKKSGSMTVSHVRFGKKNIAAPYLIEKAAFVACHHSPLLNQVDMLEHATENGIFLLNSSVELESVWQSLPLNARQHILNKNLKVYVIDANSVARETGMGRRINTIMQTCFFAISGVLEREEAIAKIKSAIEKTYSKKGAEVVEKNFKAVDQTLANLHELVIPAELGESLALGYDPMDGASEFVSEIIGAMIAGKGDDLPVSVIPDNGSWPTATTRFEKRDLADFIPTWTEDLCIQCGKCAMVCPHAAIRSKLCDATDLEGSPEGFVATKAKGIKEGDPKYIIQVSPLDCTGCELCVEACPGIDRKNPERNALSMQAKEVNLKQEIVNWDFFLKIPEMDRTLAKKNVKHTQMLQPLFEFSGACSGCGETAYIKTITQLFGDRMMVANATGCSSIYGGNLPTTPYAQDKNGRGPAWANSLFEDNAEFGLGMRLATEKRHELAMSLLDKFWGILPDDLVQNLQSNPQVEESDIAIQRSDVEALKNALAEILAQDDNKDADRLLEVADYLVRKSVWIFGGDGWAYDIGFSGLDHIMATGADVNILVMDTEVYSNTGGQASKSTPKGAVAQFAAGGKAVGKKDITQMAMSYGNVYVGKIAIGANDAHTIKTLVEAENYRGPSLIIAYSPCVAHGYDLKKQLSHQKMAVDSGYWPLFRFNPEEKAEGKNPFHLDSRPPKIPVHEYVATENRFQMLVKSQPEKARQFADELQLEVDAKWNFYSELAAKKVVPEAEVETVKE